MPIKAGDRIRIKPEWQDAGDDQIQWIALDDESQGRVTIQAQIPGMPILPTQVVTTDMIERGRE